MKRFMFAAHFVFFCKYVYKTSTEDPVSVALIHESS